MPLKLPRVVAGQALEPRHLNLIYAALERIGNFAVAQGGPLKILQDDPTGIVVGMDDIPWCASFWIRIDGYASINRYAWTRMYEKSDGDFVAGTGAGDTGTTTAGWATEANAVATVPTGVIARAWLDVNQGHPIFQADICS